MAIIIITQFAFSLKNKNAEFSPLLGVRDQRNNCPFSLL